MCKKKKEKWRETKKKLKTKKMDRNLVVVSIYILLWLFFVAHFSILEKYYAHIEWILRLPISIFDINIYYTFVW